MDKSHKGYRLIIVAIVIIMGSGIVEASDVWAWGGCCAKLGSNTPDSITSPVRINGLTDIIAIEGSWDSTVALKNDGTIWTLGSNRGTTTTIPESSPVRADSITGATAIAVGNGHTLAVAGGSAWGWGDNFYGQVGRGGSNNYFVYPARAQDFPYTVIAVAAGNTHSLFVKTDGTVNGMGQSNFGEVGIVHDEVQYLSNNIIGVTDVIAIAAGASHSIALKNDGTVWTWGRNQQGQLGNGNHQDSPNPTPVKVNALDNVIAIAGGGHYSIALKNDGTVWTWGTNWWGQLGDGTTTNRDIPVQVMGLSGVIGIAASEDNTIALKNDGTVWTWGSNYRGQLGIGVQDNFPHMVPVQVKGLFEVSTVAGGGLSTYAIGSFDLTPPTSNIELSGTIGNNNWYTSDIQVTLTATDNLGGSGITKTEYSIDNGVSWIQYSNPFTVSNEGTTTISYRSIDIAGNIEQTKNQMIQIDKTAPSISGAATTSPNANDWYKTDVTIKFTASDAGSGIDTVTPDTTISIEGTSQSVSGTATDNAGNSASATVSDINIDKTAPSITIIAPIDGKEYLLNQPLFADWSASDIVSGIDSSTGTYPNGGTIDTSLAGIKTFIVEAEDNAGNSMTKTVTYHVNFHFNFTGFFQPIDNLPLWNTVKAKSAIPTKFSLDGYQGLDIFSTGYPMSQKSNCDTTAPTDVIEETITAGSSSLSYNASLDQYNYVWKTDKTWAGSCRQLTLLLKDGTYHNASFKFLK